MHDDDQAIIDAAVEVATFSKVHAYPAEGSPAFFEFAEKLDALATAIRKRHPHFDRNVRNTAILKRLGNLPTNGLTPRP